MKGRIPLIMLSIGLAVLFASGCYQQRVVNYQTNYDPVPVEELYEMAGDLVVELDEVPDSENGYVVAFDAFERMEISLEPGSESRYEDRGGAVGEAKLNFDQTLTQVKLAIEMPVWQEVLDTDAISAFPKASQAKEYVKASVFYALESLKQGDSGEATDLLVTSWNLSRRFEDSCMDEISLLVAMTCRSITAKGIESALVSGQLADADVQRLAAQLQFFQGTDPNRFRTERMELTTSVLPMIAEIDFSQMIAIMTAGELVDDEEDFSDGWEQLYDGLTFDRRATAESVIQEAKRKEAFSVGENWAEIEVYEDITHWDEQVRALGVDESRLGSDKRYLHETRKELEGLGNPMGKELILMLVGPDRSYFDTIRESVSNNRIVRVGVVAASLEARGEEIGLLSDLGIIESELIDPYSGGRLGFDAERREAWSVGKEGGGRVTFRWGQ